MAKFRIIGGGWKRLQFLSSNLNQAIKVHCAKELQSVLEDEARAIIKRTQSGQDIDFAPFKPYSAAYKKWKEGHTASGKRLATKRNPLKAAVTSVVNLTLTGNMLKSLRTRVRPTDYGIQGEIFLMGREADKGRWNQRLRKWFGFDREQLKRIVNRLYKKLKI